MFSQGETLDELRENIRDVYDLMIEDQQPPTDTSVQTEEIRFRF